MEFLFHLNDDELRNDKNENLIKPIGFRILKLKLITLSNSI